jgi:outer membrane protein assembly factor BamB
MRHQERGTRSVYSLKLAATLTALLLAAACSKDKNVEQPAKLTPLPNPSLRVQHVWSATVDSKKAVALRLGAGIAIANHRVYAAGHGGEVVAFDLDTGHTAWRVKTKAPLSGGTAASADLVVAGASDGQVFAFNAANGQLRWKTRVNGELLAPAAIGPKLIVVRAVNGKLHGLSAEDGHELWAQEQAVPRLSLRGTSHPLIVGDVVLCGFDNGKVMAVNAGDGTVQWEAQVTPPHGRTELERLVDIDSAVAVSGHDVYAVGFQGKVAMLALDTGQVWWSHDASSYRGLILDDETLYVSDADGQVVALKARTGAEVWRQPVLLHRGLSALALMDDSIVLGDFQGYVHWIDKTSGALAARVRTGKVRVSQPPAVAGNMVVVINDRGQINAYRVTPIAGAVATASKPAPEKPAEEKPAPAVPESK